MVVITLTSSAFGEYEVEPGPLRIGDLEEVRAYIDAADFERIRESLGRETLPNVIPITPKYAQFCERQYRRWLFLRRKFEGELMPPSADIDVFWHAHILDTYQYRNDCDRIFGYYLQHNPYFGANGPRDEENWLAAAGNLLRRYQETFGRPLTRFTGVKEAR
jgi:Glycine-rich domain-containing protein-like